MTSSDTNINATVEQLAQTVTSTGAPPDNDLCDWSQGHMLVDWHVMLLNDAFIIAGVGLVVWLIVRKRK